jgi:hypothetical protein
MAYFVIIISILISGLSGCTFYGFGQHTVSGLVCQDNFETGQQCTLYDPVYEQQVAIDPNSVITTCDSDRTKTVHTCYYSYTDAMGTTWNSKTFQEKR